MKDASNGEERGGKPALSIPPDLLDILGDEDPTEPVKVAPEPPQADARRAAPPPLTAVPEVLKSLPRWVAWGPDPETGRPKCPLIASKRTVRASTRKPDTWCEWGFASKVREKYCDDKETGIGFVFTEGDGLIYVDVDDCIDEAGELRPWAAPFIEPFMGRAYMEVSPSGRGLHIIAKGKLPVPEGVAGGKANFPDAASGARVPEVAMFTSGKYTTITGRVWKSQRAIQDATDEAAEVWAAAGISASRTGTDAGDAPREEDLPEVNKRLMPARAREEFKVCAAADATDRSAARFAQYATLAEKYSPEQIFALVTRDHPEWYASSGAEEKGRDQTWADINRTVTKVQGQQFEAQNELERRLIEVNEEYFVVDEVGRIYVGAFKPDPNFDKRQRLVRYSFGAFLDKMQPERVIVGTGKKQTTLKLGPEWLDWSERRQYEGVTFDPSADCPKDYLNLWRGWAIKPAPGDWSVLREHIEAVVCSSSPGLIRYVLGWLAFLVQRPWERPETAIVLRGKEGTGKSIFGQMVRRLAGSHGIQVSNPRHLTGNFNAHLQDVLVLQADEAFYAGDKAHVGVLKSLLTDPELVIEGKGRDAVLWKNLLHVVMTSNEKWVVPAGMEARRFAVIDVSDSQRGQKEYFRRLAAALRSDEVMGAMLHDLQRMDISEFEVREVPKTSALEAQKLRSLDGFHSWLVDALTRGRLGDYDEWAAWVETGTLYNAYREWMKEQARYDRTLTENIFGRELGEVFTWMRRRPAKLTGPGERNRPGFLLGTVEEARGRFCGATGLSPTIFTHGGMP